MSESPANSCGFSSSCAPSKRLGTRRNSNKRWKLLRAVCSWSRASFSHSSTQEGRLEIRPSTRSRSRGSTPAFVNWSLAQDGICCATPSLRLIRTKPGRRSWPRSRWGTRNSSRPPPTRRDRPVPLPLKLPTLIARSRDPSPVPLGVLLLPMRHAPCMPRNSRVSPCSDCGLRRGRPAGGPPQRAACNEACKTASEGGCGPRAASAHPPGRCLGAPPDERRRTCTRGS